MPDTEIESVLVCLMDYMCILMQGFESLQHLWESMACAAPGKKKYEPRQDKVINDKGRPVNRPTPSHLTELMFFCAKDKRKAEPCWRLMHLVKAEMLTLVAYQPASLPIRYLMLLLVCTDAVLHLLNCRGRDNHRLCQKLFWQSGAHWTSISYFHHGQPPPDTLYQLSPVLQ